MRKDITKKFLMKENRHIDKMISKDTCSFIARRKINRDENQISYDEIEFRNVFSTEFTDLNTNNILKSGYKIKKVVPKNGESIEFNMIYCEESTFEMGTDAGWENNPKKVEKIERSFWLCEIEVTQELYELVMGYNPSEFKGKEDSSQRPVERFTWYDAVMFCNKLSEELEMTPYYKITNERKETDQRTKIVHTIKADISINEGANGFRLPYEKEWEYAAKANTNNKYAGTNEDSKLEEYAWFSENSNKQTHPVKTKKPNEWGFYDMIGNVQERCNDLYSYSTQSGVRGGDWNSKSTGMSNTLHQVVSMDFYNFDLGFRIAAYL